MSNKVFDYMLEEGGEKIDLFRTEPTVAESTLPRSLEGSNIDTKAIHATLATAGLAPGYGIVPDMIDSFLWAFEGEFGEAALSFTSAVPVIGQFAAAKRALRAARDAGEEMITVYRGVDKWHPGQMVRNGRFVGGGEYVGKGKTVGKNDAWITTNKDYATGEYFRGKPTREILLEFEIPKKIYNKDFLRTGIHQGDELGLYRHGVPKEFLIKVHKYKVTPKEHFIHNKGWQHAKSGVRKVKK
jgi:hypothetical protein